MGKTFEKQTIILLAIFLLLPGCGINRGIDSADKEPQNQMANGMNAELLNPDGMTLEERFRTPEGFSRIQVDESSFAAYLRNLPLKPHGSKVEYYNKQTKPKDVHEAVVDMDVGERDLQQCADAVIRLRAEYLFHNQLYDKISFSFTNGFKADYTSWMRGKRIVVDGNEAYWVDSGRPSNDYESFRKYLDIVFAYAGTLSLSQELQNVPLEDMQIGDVFLQGGSPGHCVLVVDIAENEETCERLFMIAQSYMPAQDIHVLKNLEHKEFSPWYSAKFGDRLETPEWTFSKGDLMRFPE